MSGALTVPLLTVQPIALEAAMATPPAREPRQKLAVPLTSIPALPEMLRPKQLLALKPQDKPVPPVEVPVQLVALASQDNPVPSVEVP